MNRLRTPLFNGEKIEVLTSDWFIFYFILIQFQFTFDFSNFRYIFTQLYTILISCVIMTNECYLVFVCPSICLPIRPSDGLNLMWIEIVWLMSERGMAYIKVCVLIRLLICIQNTNWIINLYVFSAISQFTAQPFRPPIVRAPNTPQHASDCDSRWSQRRITHIQPFGL